VSCQLGNSPQEDLAKFGDRPDIKVFKRKRNLHTFGYILEPNRENLSK
jgi:hypothetical protein